MGSEGGHLAMTDATLRIKNLSIALEAVSHIALGGSVFHKIESLLRNEIEAYKKEQETANPPARPAATTFDDKIPF